MAPQIFIVMVSRINSDKGVVFRMKDKGAYTEDYMGTVPDK